MTIGWLGAFTCFQPSPAHLMSLWPAARKKEGPNFANGTPWTWPWFPWSLFAVLVVGIGLRSYWLSVSFQVGRVGDVGFQPYFLIPLGFVTALLLFELATTAGNELIRRIALTVPLGLLFLAFPGDGGNKIAVHFLQELCNGLGSPAEITLWGLVVFYAIAWIRGIQIAEWGVMTSLAALAWIDANTISLSHVAAPAAWPLQFVAAIQFALAIRNGRLWRFLLPIVILLGIAWQKTWYDWPIEMSLIARFTA